MARKRKEALVENNPNLVKNLDTGAVINTNTSELLARREQIGKLQEKDAEIESMKADIEELKKLVKNLGKK
tara:strand:+ start:508 stop:720 length:213 start_codon:yes stop_codon:yes gene_type:complete